RHHAKLGFGQLVANLDRHRQFSLTVRMFLRAFFGGRETAKQSTQTATKRDWIASTLALLAMTAVDSGRRLLFIAQFAAQDFPDIGLRQVGPELDLLRH